MTAHPIQRPAQVRDWSAPHAAAACDLQDLLPRATREAGPGDRIVFRSRDGYSFCIWDGGRLLPGVERTWGSAPEAIEAARRDVQRSGSCSSSSSSS